MLTHLLHTYDFNLRHARHLVTGLTAEQGVAQPGGLVNHVCWTLGHLATATDVAMLELGGEMVIPEAVASKFFPGVPITGDVADYPSIEELMGLLEAGHARVAARVPEATAEQLAATPALEMVQRRFSRVGDFIHYIMSGHEGVHLGQIADVRRALGLENTDL